MSGHSKWSSIKHKKAATDQKRGQVFSKLLKAISIAARDNADPQFNAQLKQAIAKAKENNVPQDNIDRAIKRNEDKDLQELIIEAYGPGGVAMIINAITDNNNRAIAEIKHLLNQHQSKIAVPNSVLWAFDGDQPKFPQELNESDRGKLEKLIEKLEEHDDVQKVITNLKT
ncbi:MAG: YebC/PmpR family DNA-binding transcriptional regulator [Patescibacteria group bacterium]